MEQNTPTVKINLAWKHNEMIGNRIDSALSFYLSGNYPSWYFNLKAIKFLVIQKLDIKEREELKYMEMNITSCLTDKKKVTPLIEDYDIKIKELLDKYGFLNPDQEDTTGIYGQRW